MLIPVAVVAFLVYLCFLVLRRSKPETIQSSLALLFIGSALFLSILTVRTSIKASFNNSDIPVEMMVYTQTSPDIKLTMKSIDHIAHQMGATQQPDITIDQTSGFTWPWTWYLRNYETVDYPVFSTDNSPTTTHSEIILVHSRNKEASDKAFSRDFLPSIRVPHRWWFPEYTYRDLTIAKLASQVVSIKYWQRITRYTLYRKGIGKNRRRQ